MSLSRLIFPHSITFIGGHECAVTIQRCHDFGFQGKIHAVHPTRDHISGIPTVALVASIDDPIDAAFVEEFRPLGG
jgi:acetate---CoA ligase (ADP-forming)